VYQVKHNTHVAIFSEIYFTCISGQRETYIQFSLLIQPQMIKQRNTKYGTTHNRARTVLGRASAHAFVVASRKRLHIKSFLVLRKFWYVFIWNKYTSSVLMWYNYNIYILLLLLLNSFQNNFYLLFTIFHFSNIRYTIKCVYVTDATS
jgi:hypothetical protein